MRRETAAKAKQREQKAQITETGSTVVDKVGASQDIIAGAAETTGAKGLGVKTLKGFGVAGSVGGAALNAKGQIVGGKPAGSAIANATGDTGTSVAAGALVGALFGAAGANPLTIALGAVAGSVGADASGLSEAGGNLAERAYNEAGQRQVCSINPMTGGCY